METPTNIDSSTEPDLDQIIAGLDVDFHVLPVEAIRAAQAHRDLIVPRLIEVIRKAAGDARAG